MCLGMPVCLDIYSSFEIAAEPGLPPGSSWEMSAIPYYEGSLPFPSIPEGLNEVSGLLEVGSILFID